MLQPTFNGQNHKLVMESDNMLVLRQACLMVQLICQCSWSGVPCRNGYSLLKRRNTAMGADKSTLRAFL